MKVTVDLPNDLVRRVKLRAINDGRRMRDIVEELLNRGLNEQKGNAESIYSIQTDPETMLPVVCSRSEAPGISSQTTYDIINQAQEQDDLERAGLSL